MQMDIIVLGSIEDLKLKNILFKSNSPNPPSYWTSARHESKIGFRGGNPYLVGDTQNESILIHLDDIECIYCFQGGAVVRKTVEQFFKIYKNLIV